MQAASLAKILGDRVAGPSFGIPGGGPVLELIDALETAGTQFVTTHFEGSAALMAGAVGRLSGRPGLAMSIKGPGLANLASGLATCRLEAMPLIAAVEAYDRDTDMARQHKRLDHDGFIRAVAKAHAGLDHPAEEIASVCDAAARETPGPVLLELAATPMAPTGAHFQAKPNAEALLELAAKAERPVVISGTLAGRLGLGAKLGALNIPVFTTAAAKGVVDERLPVAAGVFTGAGKALSPEAKLLASTDLVVGIGLRANEILSLDAIECRLVSIEAERPEAPERYAALGLPDDAPRLLDTLAFHRWGLDELAVAKQAMRDALLGTQFLPAHCFEAATTHFGADMRLVLDTGHFCTIGEHLGVVSAPDRYLSSGMGRSMGAALPFAIGGAIYDAGLPTVLAIGDGGIGMFFAELRIAVARKLPLLILFMRDGAFGSIRSAAHAKGLTEAPLTMTGATWRGAADGIGLWTAAAPDEQGLRDALAEWRPGDGPGMIEIGFDADLYRDMTDNLRS